MWRGIGAVLWGLLEGDFWISACFGWFLGEPVVHSSKWTTGSTIFPDFGLFPAVSWELVVHSSKWTTGSGLFLGSGLFPALSWELVVHSPKWTTGSKLFPDSGPFSANSWELVGHSLKWATGSRLLPAFAYFRRVLRKLGASPSYCRDLLGGFAC